MPFGIGTRCKTNSKIQGEPDCWDAYFWIQDTEVLQTEFKKNGATVEAPYRWISAPQTAQPVSVASAMAAPRERLVRAIRAP